MVAVYATRLSGPPTEHHHLLNGHTLLGLSMFLAIAVVAKWIVRRPTYKVPRTGKTAWFITSAGRSKRSPGRILTGLAGDAARVGAAITRTIRPNEEIRRLAETTSAKAALTRARREGTNAKSGYRPAPTSLAALVELAREAIRGPLHWLRAEDGWDFREAKTDTGPEPAKQQDRQPSSSSPGPATAAMPSPAEPPNHAIDNRPRPAGGPMPANATLFLAADRVATQPFGNLISIEKFLDNTFNGCQQLISLYQGLAARLTAELNIDRYATQHLESAAKTQAALVGHVQETAGAVRTLLNMSPEEAAERGIKMPDPELLDGDTVEPLTPELFEQLGTVANTPFDDNPKQGLLLVMALHDASEQMHAMWTRLKSHLADKRMPLMILTPMGLTTIAQNAVTTDLAACDNAYQTLLKMTHRELAASTMHTPTAGRRG